MNDAPRIVDAEFEVLHGPDRSTGKLEAWQVEPGKPIPPYPSLKARLFHYWWLLARAAGADEEIFESPWYAQLVWAIFTAAWMSALLALAFWAKTTAFGTRHG
ncbi:hypothetical protein [Caulobacter sp. FWC2]|uniref:hypothetical protein n=1 Tax=Caulobacter sp. FWC2 TaxID=69664 RepID=UPI000C1580B1|nr:hypothetical protein [Caulobacter sp. FWC2]PIB91296.1 hypothetical protein CSW62_06725 [Caulobacter sp. FWC2]